MPHKIAYEPITIDEQWEDDISRQMAARSKSPQLLKPEVTLFPTPKNYR